MVTVDSPPSIARQKESLPFCTAWHLQPLTAMLSRYWAASSSVRALDSTLCSQLFYSSWAKHWRKLPSSIGETDSSHLDDSYLCTSERDMPSRLLATDFAFCCPIGPWGWRPASPSMDFTLALKFLFVGFEEMILQLRALIPFPEDWNLILSGSQSSLTPVPGYLIPSSGLCGH